MEAGLIVLDSGNNRILFWNSFPTANGQPADRVLGQGNFSTSITDYPSGTTSSSGMNFPFLLACSGRQLFLAGNSNDRILIWDTLEVSNGQAADRILGKSDFSTSLSGAAAADTLMDPTGIAAAGKHLIVAEANHHRFLIYNLAPDLCEARGAVSIKAKAKWKSGMSLADCLDLFIIKRQYRKSAWPQIVPRPKVIVHK